MASSNDFYGCCLQAIDDAEESGTINKRRAARLRDRLDNPRQCERMRARTSHWMDEQGKKFATTKDGGSIDWNAFFDKFFSTWLPMILSFFKIA